MMLPYTDFFKYLGMVCDKQINLNTVADATLCPCPAGTFRVKDFVQKHNLFNRLHMASQDIRTRYSGWYVYESDLGHSLLTTRQRGGQSPSVIAAGIVEKDVGSQRHHAFMVCHMYVWIGKPYSSIDFTRQCGCTVFD